MKKEHPYHEASMFKGAPAENFRKAELLRENMTPAETLLWEKIKDNQLGVKFRRQHPIQLFIVDFYCHEQKLIIEIDGEYHNSIEQIQKDIEREGLLIFQDLSVLRFTNAEVLENMDMVLKNIKDRIIF